MQTGYIHMTLAQIASCGSEALLERELAWEISEGDQRLQAANIEVINYQPEACAGDIVEVKVEYILTN